jgi:hypothetical protein
LFDVDPPLDFGLSELIYLTSISSVYRFRDSLNSKFDIRLLFGAV